MDKSCMSAFSDIINADNHKHWMLQLFYAFDNDLQITVNGNEISCKCIAVNTKRNITDAALNAGFDSPSHFAATSKKLTGMSATNISKDSVFLKAFYV